ncbi:beta-galactosidase 17 [Quercus suber]|uniref:Beta-galactosidase n=1 Tax=Quercus suber TaxID=58331 RepID=A0AAW0LTS4_QUESU
MARNRSSRNRTTFFFCTFFAIIALCAFVPVFAPLPSLSSHLPHDHSHSRHKKVTAQKFEIANDMFWKDGQPFQIIGGDLHYFRVLPEYWEDRLLKAKALGLNTIQTYVPWNLHEPKPGKLVFERIADIVSFLKLCHKLDFLVMLRPGPYICAEWDLGGFPAWLLAIEPAVRLRSSDPAFLHLVEGWWAILLQKVAPLLYENGGPVIMVQIENEYGSYGNDKAYLHQLVTFARSHLGDDIILYTTDGGTRETLERGTISGDAVFSAVDFTTGDEPWPIFQLQKKFNAPGKSPPLSAEFYTGWLTHWGEKLAATDADFTAAALEKILARNGSAVLYMAHGGTNFGFYNGANTGGNESDYKPDLTSYDYDAPIRETGDVNNAKFKAIRSVIKKYSAKPLPSVPPNKEKAGYGPIDLQKKEFLFDILNRINSIGIVKSENPISMESVGQMFGFLLYVSEYAAKADGSVLSIPKVQPTLKFIFKLINLMFMTELKFLYHALLKIMVADQYLLCFLVTDNINWSFFLSCFFFFWQGILSSVYLDGRILQGWKMLSFPFNNLNEVPKTNPVIAYSGSIEKSARRKAKENVSKEPSFYAGHFSIDKENDIKDTFISFNGWGKGIAFVNEFNIGRYWPMRGPQCSLYVPAPVLKQGENVVVVLELESPSPKLVIHSVDQPDFTCQLISQTTNEDQVN